MNIRRYCSYRMMAGFVGRQRSLFCVPLANIAAPIGPIIPDGLLIFGQIAGLISFRFRYTPRTTIVNVAMLEEYREQARALPHRVGDIA